ncbi:sigma-54-dependent Fis family transcriptional regulator [Pullulanibacillus camelliae]|uniref:Sigma-54-dependent Fis family transcriptional regulator n=1 Tax=Pullulanibacillus camelliae TaxID=1707096 RepID=A0A8J2VPC6_9BACL|nr:sigma-54-dependent Fis family transcriptional regulator [Pullulanibacillus camelliae]GGE37679.1 sigma-54-dependent Fis family transcriptional regulator [Pullulanibacillus camelliae]
MKSIVLIGGGKHSLYILQTLLNIEGLKIVGVVDKDAQSPALQLAREHGISTGPRWQSFITDTIDTIINAHSDRLYRVLQKYVSYKTVVIPFSVVRIMTELMEEKEVLIQKIKEQSKQQRLILSQTHDGMLAINKEGRITILNPRAEKMMRLKSETVIGQKVEDVISSTQLPRVLQTKEPEFNQEQTLENGDKIITTRLPMLADDGSLLGAFAVFKDITDIQEMAEEVTNLKSIQTMLHAIIQSSEEAITVVDEKGNGLLINPAYTRLTGLREADVIGKPASIDISEGESMHMHVLKTRQPVRGARMKVGQAKRDVIVNVAPIIVNDELKGSVGVIQDVSEMSQLNKELDRAKEIIRTLEAKYTFADIIGESEPIKVMIEQARLAANVPINILLRGESGTGKELFAHAIHNASRRRLQKFIRVNCAAISESLLESEMFGYEEGAFSGAKKGGKRGYFEEANGGSIFLDEIAELSPQMQAKLLRVLQENEIVRVGGTKPIPIDVRIITATNVDLESRIAEKRFREDLYYRLNRMPIFIPPLRHRKEDILLLAQHLIKKINQDFGRNVETISEEAIEKLKDYDWPGNVRELENILGRAVIHMNVNETEIGLMHLPPLALKVPEKDEIAFPKEVRTSSLPLTDQLQAVEQEIIKQTYEEMGYNKTKTAQALGISVRNLYYKMEKLQIDKSNLQ